MRPILIAIALAIICLLSEAQMPPRSTIRVGLWTLWHDKEVTISPIGSAQLRACDTCTIHSFKSITVKLGNSGLTWTEDHSQSHSATELFIAGNYLISAHQEPLTLTYPLRITAHTGTLIIVATLPIERYVELVVSAESGAADSAESLKALAVVARSFAVSPTHGHHDFDVCDSTHCQWVRWRSTAVAYTATLATAGESLWSHGSRAAVYFHQNCGGRTAAANEVWPARTTAARSSNLISLADPYCQRVGSSEWSATISRSDLTQALAAAGLAAPGWKILRIAERGESGRATVLLVDSTRISAEDFRLAVGRVLGWNRIRSNWFEISAQDDSFLFHGRGSGHGVGLCQVGAAEMAREGRSYREILAQYFPGATLGEVTTGSAWLSLKGTGFTLESSESGDDAYMSVLAHALNQAESRSGLAPHTSITVRAYRSTPAFRDATLAPGWVAAFTERDRIAMQPPRVLAARKLLEGTLRHEFLHVLVEDQATERTPLWLREGLVEAWSGDASQETRRPALTLDFINEKLAHATDEIDSTTAHQAAGWYARRLLDHYGRVQVLNWLRSDLPQTVLVGLR